MLEIIILIVAAISVPLVSVIIGGHPRLGHASIVALFFVVVGTEIRISLETLARHGVASIDIVAPLAGYLPRGAQIFRGFLILEGAKWLKT